MIREVKTRLALDLHYKKLPLTYWKQNVDRIVTLINLHSEKSHRYPLNKMLKDYFTSAPPVVPQKQEKMYKFKIGDKVCLDLSAKQRKDLSFKFSLQRGKTIWSDFRLANFLTIIFVFRKNILCDRDYH
jgi:hypothetical protein